MACSDIRQLNTFVNCIPYLHMQGISAEWFKDFVDKLLTILVNTNIEKLDFNPLRVYKSLLYNSH